VELAHRNHGCRISDQWTFRGYRVLVLENELLRIGVLLDKGADIFEFLYKPVDLDFLWRTPTFLRRRPILDGLPSRIGPFLDTMEGGWQEVLPNGGRVCEYLGAEFGLHGEVWTLPWEHRITVDTAQRVEVTLAVRCVRTPLRLERTMSLTSGQPRLELREELVNESDEELPFMWGHHPLFGPQFVDQDTELRLPPCEAVVDLNVDEASRFDPGQHFPWPVGRARDGSDVDVARFPPRDARISDMLYLTDLSEGWAELVNHRRGVGLRLDFDLQTFSCLWAWLEFGGNRGCPSWGRYYAVALEPFSSWPAILTKAMENGTELRLPPRATRRTWLAASVIGPAVAR